MKEFDQKSLFEIDEDEVVAKCVVSVLNRTFTIFGSKGTIKVLNADTPEEFENMHLMVELFLADTPFLMYDDYIPNDNKEE